MIAPAPLAILDVHYEGQGARAACVVAQHWSDAAAHEERTTMVSSVAPYKPGAFFERELPCLVQVLSLLRVAPRAIMVDAYVDLDEQGTPGLGAHVHAHFGGSLPVIGVAKTAFRGSTFASRVLRGSSQRPLFVTARGIPLAEAAELVKGMHGEHRIPTLVGRADALARGHVRPASCQ